MAKANGKYSAKTVKKDVVNESEIKDSFNQALVEEAQEKAEGLAKYKDLGPDGFTKMIMEIFKLECAPSFKENFSDPRWPRNEKGEAIKVDRVYFLALRGPREAQLGFRSIGQYEINNDAKIIIDRIGEDVDEKIVLAKKWNAEQSHYRYFWIRENEQFEDEQAMQVFLDRFAPLQAKPSFVFGPIGAHLSLVMNDPNGQWIK